MPARRSSEFPRHRFRLEPPGDEEVVEFPVGATVLEIGCGTGPVARVVAAWPNVREVVGVDPSPHLVEKARALSSGVPSLTFEVGDGRRLRFNASSFDVAILHTVLTHVPCPEAVLAEAHRVLRPGGWLGVCDGDFSTATLSIGDLDPLQVCVQAFVEGFVNDRWMVRRMSRLAVSAAGFEVSPLRSYGLVETGPGSRLGRSTPRFACGPPARLWRGGTPRLRAVPGCGRCGRRRRRRSPVSGRPAGAAQLLAERDGVCPRMPSAPGRRTRLRPISASSGGR